MQERVGIKKREAVFYIPYPKDKSAWNKRFGLNAYWSGKHFRARAQDAKDVHNLVYYCLKKDHVRKNIYQVPVEVNFYWSDRIDIDNHAALGKMIVDALKGYLIKNDSPKYFQKVTHEFWKGNTIKVVVKEYNNERRTEEPNCKNCKHEY